MWAIASEIEDNLAAYEVDLRTSLQEVRNLALIVDRIGPKGESTRFRGFKVGAISII